MTDPIANDSQPTDKQLIAEIAAGSSPAFEALYDRHAPGLKRFLFKRHFPGDESTVDDVIQTTFLKVYQSVGTYDPEYDVRPWIFHIAAMTAIDVKRAAGRRFAHSLNAVAAEGDSRSFEFDVEDHRTPAASQGLESAEDAAMLKEAIDGLTQPWEREALELVAFGDVTWKDAAYLMGVPLGTFKVRMNRTYAKLRSKMGDDEAVA